MKPRMKLPESVERELEGLSDADRFRKVMGRLVQVKPEKVKATEAKRAESAEYRATENRRKPAG